MNGLSLISLFSATININWEILLANGPKFLFCGFIILVLYFIFTSMVCGCLSAIFTEDDTPILFVKANVFLISS